MAEKQLDENKHIRPRDQARGHKISGRQKIICIKTKLQYKSIDETSVEKYRRNFSRKG